MKLINLILQKIKENKELKYLKLNKLKLIIKKIILIFLKLKESYLIDELTLKDKEIINIIIIIINILQIKDIIIIIKINKYDYIISTLNIIKEKFQKKFLLYLNIINLNNLSLSSSHSSHSNSHNSNSNNSNNSLEDNNIRKLEENEINLIQDYVFEQFYDLKEFCENHSSSTTSTTTTTSSISSNSKNLRVSEKIIVYSMNLEPNIFIGSEFLAGWLIGYPVIYNCPLLPTPPTSNILSMQQLHKITLSVTVNFRSNELDTIENNIIQEFTYPEILHEQLMNQVNDRINEIISKTSGGIEVEDLWSENSLLCNGQGEWNCIWNCNHEIVVCPALSL